MKVFNKILIANRGEIALRIIRSLKAMNVRTVTVYSEKDKNADFVKAADESYFLEGSSLAETYLNIEKIVRIATDSNTEAIHPGYGFLSENPGFAEAVSSKGIQFIGPAAEMIRLMGDKEQARKIARESGVPVLSGLEGKPSELEEKAGEMQYPVMVKASAGGGGKAIRIVRSKEELPAALETAGREALNYFGKSDLIIEKYLEEARHIEVQVIADHYGNTVIAGDRECTVQRRHQKVIEEAPVTGISENTRKALYDVSLKLCRNIGYINAGTIEFLMDRSENFYFLEMNTRIQVEHPVTEMVTGLDIVKQQVLISAGNRLEIKQNEIVPVGHSIEARLYAEDPEKDFLPSPGKIWYYSEPDLPGLRIDSAISRPGNIDAGYDPMISKVVVHADNRSDAIIALQKALLQYEISGISTNREFMVAILAHRDFSGQKVSTSWLEKKRNELLVQVHSEKSRTQIQKVVSAWLLKRTHSKTKELTSPWISLGRWRQFEVYNLIFGATEHRVILKKRFGNRIEILIDRKAFTISDPEIHGNHVRFKMDDHLVNAVVITGMDITDSVLLNGYEYQLRPLDYLPEEPFIKENLDQDASGIGIIKSPLHGKIVKLAAGLDSFVNKGDLLLTLDAMKIENKILAPADGKICRIHINEGDQVSINQVLIEIEHTQNLNS